MAMFAQQFAVVVIVMCAAVYLAWRYLPRWRNRCQAGIARWLDAPGRPPRVRAWAARLACGTHTACGDGCGTCGGCSPGIVQRVAPPRTRKEES